MKFFSLQPIRIFSYLLLAAVLVTSIMGGQWHRAKAYDVTILNGQTRYISPLDTTTYDNKNIGVQNGGKLIIDGTHNFKNLTVETGGIVTHSPVNDRGNPAGWQNQPPPPNENEDAVYKFTDFFAMQWDGWINLNELGDYYFYIASDDGNAIYIDSDVDTSGSKEIEEGNDQLWSCYGTQHLGAIQNNVKGDCTSFGGQDNWIMSNGPLTETKYRFSNSSPGLHRIRIKYFEYANYAKVAFGWMPPPNIKRSYPVPKQYLFSQFTTNPNLGDGLGLKVYTGHNLDWNLPSSYNETDQGFFKEDNLRFVSKTENISFIKEDSFGGGLDYYKGQLYGAFGQDMGSTSEGTGGLFYTAGRPGGERWQPENSLPNVSDGQEGGMKLIISGKLTVYDGGKIIAMGKGYRGGIWLSGHPDGYGPGAGSGGDASASGGGHGGLGGAPVPASHPRGATYGEKDNPGGESDQTLWFGSGGGKKDEGHVSAYGGGRIWIESSELEISGTAEISADGGGWWSTAGYDAEKAWAVGGSGGSITIKVSKNLQFSTLTTGGVFARGSHSYGGAGGGGRIAIYVPPSSGLDAVRIVAVSAAGGDGEDDGVGGTIVIRAITGSNQPIITKATYNPADDSLLATVGEGVARLKVKLTINNPGSSDINATVEDKLFSGFVFDGMDTARNPGQVNSNPKDRNANPLKWENLTFSANSTTTIIYYIKK